MQLKKIHNFFLNSVLPIFLASFFILSFNVTFASAAFPPECSGLTKHVPSLAEPNAGKCPSTQTKIDNATDGCADGQKLVGCGKEGLGAALPVFGCCASEYKADMSDVSTGFCSKEDVVECYPGLTAPPKPSAGGSSAYKCVEADGCQGTVVAGAQCLGGVTPKVCCQMNYCPEAPADATSAPTVAKTYKLANPLGTANLNLIAKNVINVFLGIVGALALLVFVYAGISYMVAGGAEQKVQKAKDTMRYAVIGVFIIMFSFVLTDTFISLWTVDINPPPAASPDALLTAPTQAEQDVVTLKEQQQAAQKVEADAKAAAKSAQSDVCGQTPATSGYSCLTLDSAEQQDYDCLSGYCQTNSASNYICCKKK
ncbi:MAG: pilin [Patescibacteria group bacterium]|nr:pilin [Patescibacteria group bacterium]